MHKRERIGKVSSHLIIKDPLVKDVQRRYDENEMWWRSLLPLVSVER